MRKLPDGASQRKRNPPGGSHLPLAWHVQFRPELYGPATSQTAVCSESQQDRWSSKRVRRSTSRHGDNTPSATYCSPRSYAISSMAFCGLSDFGAPHAKEPFRLARNAAGTTLRLARGVSDECAVVVDLPLATPACQNVFGPSETPVFVSWQSRMDSRDLWSRGPLRRRIYSAICILHFAICNLRLNPAPQTPVPRHNSRPHRGLTIIWRVLRLTGLRTSRGSPR
jgi:hypothetical protein